MNCGSHHPLVNQHKSIWSTQMLRYFETKWNVCWLLFLVLNVNPFWTIKKIQAFDWQVRQYPFKDAWVMTLHLGLETGGGFKFGELCCVSADVTGDLSAGQSGAHTGQIGLDVCQPLQRRTHTFIHYLPWNVWQLRRMNSPIRCQRRRRAGTWRCSAAWTGCWYPRSDWSQWSGVWTWSCCWSSGGHEDEHRARRRDTGCTWLTLSCRHRQMDSK